MAFPRTPRGSTGLSRAGTQIRGSGGQFAPSGDWFKVTATGPLFDMRGIAALRQAERTMSAKVATAAQRHILTIGISNFRYEKSPPTYFFQNNVEIDRVADGHVVHADQVIYGPWLEGTSSRNRTSRFKGYALFRRATQDVEARLPQILDPEERDLVRSLGGTGVRLGPSL